MILHDHYSDGAHHPTCKRCALNIAAPELLEAGKALLAKESEITTGTAYLEYRAMEAAIKKAEG